MENTQFSPSYGLLADIQGMTTASIQEIYECLTAENVQEFLDFLGTELANREDERIQSNRRMRYEKNQ